MWGNKMLDALIIVAKLAAAGFNMPEDAFSSRMLNGPHLLAPTGSDFSKYGELGTVLAGMFYKQRPFDMTVTFAINLLQDFIRI